jgi:hypothetical protein
LLEVAEGCAEIKRSTKSLHVDMTPSKQNY